MAPHCCAAAAAHSHRPSLSSSLFLPPPPPLLCPRAEYVSGGEGADVFDEVEDDATLRLFLDSADVGAWERWAEAGIFYGFTTNPSILRRDGVRCTPAAMRQLARKAFGLGVEELQLQAWGTTAKALYSCGLDLFELDARVVVKVPITLEGLCAARRLVDDGVPVTLTGLYSAHQAATALAAGAAYAAPYLGRMSDAGKDGAAEVLRMQGIVDLCTSYDGEMRLLVAAVRSAEEVAALAAEGCNTFTLSPAVAEQLVGDPLTAAAAAAFQADAEAMGA